MMRMMTIHTYNSLLEKTGEYAKVANSAIKNMKRVKEDYGSLLVRYKEAKCEIDTPNGELTKAYSKIKFLELEVVQTNAKVERVSSKKLDEVLSHQKPFLRQDWDILERVVWLSILPRK